VKVEVIAYGARRIEADLLKVGMRSEALEPVWESLHEDLLAIERLQFESEGEHCESGKWSPLSKKTRKPADAAGILRSTDALFESLAETGPGHIWAAGRTGWLFGSNVPYGHFHASGTSRMPKRPPISLTRTERAAILRKIRLYITKGVVLPL